MFQKVKRKKKERERQRERKKKQNNGKKYNVMNNNSKQRIFLNSISFLEM